MTDNNKPNTRVLDIEIASISSSIMTELQEMFDKLEINVNDDAPYKEDCWLEIKGKLTIHKHSNNTVEEE